MSRAATHAARPVLLGDAMVEGDAGQVHHLVDELRRDDLAAQLMTADLRPEPLLHRLGEVPHQLGNEVGIVGQLAGQDLGRVGVLGVGHQHGELGRRQPEAYGLSLGELSIGGQELEGTVQPTFGFERVQIAGVHVDHRQRLHAGDGEDHRLGAVVVEDQLGDLFGHRREQLVAFLDGHLAALHAAVEEDLDVDLVVAAVDACGVVDRVGVDQPAGQRVLDPPALGQSEVSAFADDPAAQVGTVHPHAVVGAIADLGVALPRRLDVCADAAVPQ